MKLSRISRKRGKNIVKIQFSLAFAFRLK
jgi:hypothetical protein